MQKKKKKYKNHKYPKTEQGEIKIQFTFCYRKYLHVCVILWNILGCDGKLNYNNINNNVRNLQVKEIPRIKYGE